MSSADPSALQLLVPGAEVLLDAVRGAPGMGLLEPAHISLGYPWLPADEALVRLADVRAAAAAVPAFPAVLTGPHRFAPDARGRVLVHARLADDSPVRALAALLRADLRDVHLSIARVLPDGDPDEVARAVALLLPLRVSVSALELTARRDGAWTQLLRAPLAG